MTELEKMIHEAVDKAFKEYLNSQAKKYQELWDKAIMKALENLSKEQVIAMSDIHETCRNCGCHLNT